MDDYECKLLQAKSDLRVLTALSRGYFAQHHVDTLNPAMTPVQFLASKFPGRTEQEYRSHLGNFQISGMTGCASSLFQSLPRSSHKNRLQLIGTLSGGQKSRVAFALLSLQHPHILLLDEVSNPVFKSSVARIKLCSSQRIIWISRVWMP